MKKIFIVSLNGISNSGGVERVVFYINEILKDKYNVCIVDINKLKCLKLSKMLMAICGRIPGKISPILASMYIKKVRGESDIIFTHGYNAPFIRADYLFAHGNTSGFLKAKGKFPFRIESFYEYMAGKLAKNVIAVSKQVRYEWNKYYKTNIDKIKVLNNCVDTNIFKPMLRKENNEINVLFCGRLEDNKGLDKLISLAKEIENYENINLIIATNNNKNVKLFDNFSKVKITVGLDISNLNYFYNKGSLLYLPSIYEGFEMVTLEALSCGIPVFGNYVGAIRELYDKNILGVYLIEENNLINSIKSIYEDFKTNEKRKYLHQEVEKQFSYEIYRKYFMEKIKL